MPTVYAIDERICEKLKIRDSIEKTFCCPYCAIRVSVLSDTRISDATTGAILYHTFRCNKCHMPVAIGRKGEVIPPMQYLPFESVSHLPESIESLYAECRKCFANECFYSTVLLARTMLMYIAVDQGASENKPFTTYIKFLEDNGYITAYIKPWVDKLRTLGNHYVHDITNATEIEATKAVTFMQYLLKTLYELPHMATED